jgi:hypothetical protein
MSIHFGSYTTTDLYLGNVEPILIQSSIGTDAADLPPPPPPDEPVPGVYEEPSR